MRQNSLVDIRRMNVYSCDMTLLCMLVKEFIFTYWEDLQEISSGFSDFGWAAKSEQRRKTSIGTSQNESKIIEESVFEKL